jgi:hypothetical protein
MSPITLELESKWLMVAEISSLSYLANYDTSRIKVTPTIELVNHHIGPMHSYNLLASSYIANGLMRFHTTLLALNQIRQGTIKRVHKNHTDEISTISKAVFITPMQDFQKAVIHKVIDSTNDPSTSILLGQLVPIGTGYLRTSIDITPYLNQYNKESGRLRELIL